ncbi:MAG: HNH endonuclease family protein [Neisseriaceae bacterium]|nr:HNH endonuclease family protein [Neisseriaceae bacterium]
MVFAKIEHYLHSTNELTIQSFSIEHVQDESSSANWVGGLGNLLPLDEKLNNEIGSGKTFLDKKNVYEKSSLLLVKHFLEMFKDNDHWDEALSKKWCAELSDLIYKACQSTFE